MLSFLCSLWLMMSTKHLQLHETSNGQMQFHEWWCVQNMHMTERDPGGYTDKQVIQNFGCAKQYAKHCKHSKIILGSKYISILSVHIWMSQGIPRIKLSA